MPEYTDPCFSEPDTHDLYRTNVSQKGVGPDVLGNTKRNCPLL